MTESQQSGVLVFAFLIGVAAGLIVGHFFEWKLATGIGIIFGLGSGIWAGSHCQ